MASRTAAPRAVAPLPAARPARRGAVPADAAARAADRASSASSSSPSSPSSSCGCGRCRSSPARQYLNAAQNNQLRTVRVAGAARRDPRPQRRACSSATPPARSVQIWPADLPKEGRAATGCSGGWPTVLNVPVHGLIARGREARRRPADARHRQARRPRGPGQLPRGAPGRVPGRRASPTRYLRDYPHRALAAHLLGHVGEMTAGPARGRSTGSCARATRSARAGSSRRTTGSCAACRARRSSASTRSAGPQRGSIPTEQPQPGNALRLTIDLGSSRPPRRRSGTGSTRRTRTTSWAANGGAIVALDPRNGADPRDGLEPDLQAERLRRPRRPEKLAPLLNRARGRGGRTSRAQPRPLAGIYPPGSTFKPVTALAAMEERVVAPYDYAAVHAGSFTLARPGVQQLDPVRRRGR